MTMMIRIMRSMTISMDPDCSDEECRLRKLDQQIESCATGEDAAAFLNQN